jgi:D-alanyl-D-alanine dipeptidase
MMKKTLFVSLLSALLVAAFPGRAQQVYFTTEELPDLIRALPAPPDSLSQGFTYDIMRYLWGKGQREDAGRAEIAKRDAVWSYEALLGEFSVPFGLNVSRETTPAIWKLLENSLSTTDQMRVAPKAFYHRRRPFEVFNEAMLTGEEAELSGEGSYPSGHTMRGWTVALLLAEINPAAADTLFARAWMYGESRVIAGAHWQSDVDATRVAAGIGYSCLQTSARFRAEMEAAQEEFRRLTAASGQQGREHFVALTEAVPDAILEIRYFSTYNFVGERIDGYLAPTALLTRAAADSLRAVSDDVMRLGYRLKIYDAYRPQEAVDHFVRWAADRKDVRMKRYFYPDLPKSVLFKQEYIMEKSGHTRGSTVDLTLFDMATEKEVDMGGTFDWFGPESHPDFCGDPDTGEFKPSKKRRALTEQQFRNRMILREAMLRHGFKPLSSEWWHFTLKEEPFTDTYFNFPVK